MVLSWGAPSDRRLGELLPCLHHYQKVRYLISYSEKEYSSSSFPSLGKLQVIVQNIFSKNSAPY